MLHIRNRLPWCGSLPDHRALPDHNSTEEIPTNATVYYFEVLFCFRWNTFFFSIWKKKRISFPCVYFENWLHFYQVLEIISYATWNSKYCIMKTTEKHPEELRTTLKKKKAAQLSSPSKLPIDSQIKIQILSCS